MKEAEQALTLIKQKALVRPNYNALPGVAKVPERLPIHTRIIKKSFKHRKETSLDGAGKVLRQCLEKHCNLNEGLLRYRKALRI